MTKLIKLNDGLEVEIELDENQAHKISDNQRIDSSIDEIHVLLKKVLEPINNTFKTVNESAYIDSAKVSVGVKIGLEGNFILAKSTAGANIGVEMTFKPNIKS